MCRQNKGPKHFLCKYVNTSATQARFCVLCTLIKVHTIWPHHYSFMFHRFFSLHLLPFCAFLKMNKHEQFYFLIQFQLESSSEYNIQVQAQRYLPNHTFVLDTWRDASHFSSIKTMNNGIKSENTQHALFPVHLAILPFAHFFVHKS